jgi:F-type H+-transporting ATPase subunit b
MEGFNWLLGFVFPYINLALFLFLATKFLKPSLASAVVKRHEQYQSSIKEANLAREAAERAKKELDQKLANLTEEIERIKANAKKQAEDEAQRIVSQAEQLANHLKTEAQRIAQAEVEQAKAVLRNDILHQVHSNIVTKLRTELDGSQQKSIVRNQLKSLPDFHTEGLR